MTDFFSQKYIANLVRIKSCVFSSQSSFARVPFIGDFFFFIHAHLPPTADALAGYASSGIVHVHRGVGNAHPSMQRCILICTAPPRPTLRRAALGALSALPRQSASDLAGSRGLFYEYA